MYNSKLVKLVNSFSSLNPRICRHHMPCFTGFNFAYTAIWNIMGLPVTQVPLGLDKNGLPLGVQVDLLGGGGACYL